MLQNQDAYTREIQEAENNPRQEIENDYRKGIEIFKQNHLLQSAVVKSDNSEHQFNLANIENTYQEKELGNTQETDISFSTSINFNKDNVTHLYQTFRKIFHEYINQDNKVKAQAQYIQDLQTFIRMSSIDNSDLESCFSKKITLIRISQIWDDLRLRDEKYAMPFVVDLMKKNQENHFEPKATNQEESENIKASLGKTIIQDIEKKQSSIKEELSAISKHLEGIIKKLEGIKSSNDQSAKKLDDFLNSQCAKELQTLDSSIYSQTKQVTRLFNKLKKAFEEFQNQNK